MAADTFIDYFLKVDGVPGTSTKEGHTDAFEIKDFSFGIENPTTIGSATGGAGAGKIKFNEFTIKKLSDKASPTFFKNCCAGAHYKNVTLTLRKAGGDPGGAGTPFLMVKFSDVLTSRYVNSASALPPPRSVDVIAAPADVIGAQIGGLTNDSGDGTPQDSISFNYAKLEASVNATHFDVRPTAAGMLTFDAASKTVKVTEAPGGVFTVGTEGGMSNRAVAEFNDLASLIGLLTNPLLATQATLTVDELRESPTLPPPPNPVLHFDVLLYTPADGVLTLTDLTRPGRRLGTLTVDPRGAPASLDLDLTQTLLNGNLNSFGIRVQLRGTPISGLTDEGPEERGTGDFEPNNGRSAHGSFTINFAVDTAAR